MSRKHHRRYNAIQTLAIKDEMTEAFLYVIQCKDENGFVKIGITNENPINRVSQLQTGNPYELLLIAAFPIPVEKRHFIESTIHKQLEAFSLRGEWFRLTAKQAVTFLVGSLNLFEEERSRSQSQGASNKQLQVVQHKFADNSPVGIVWELVKSGSVKISDIAEQAQIDRPYLTNILNGKRPATESVCKKLQRFLGQATV